MDLLVHRGRLVLLVDLVSRGLAAPSHLWLRQDGAGPVLTLLALLLVDLLHRPELLLELHPPVLEPDLDLPLCQAERMGNLNPPSPCQIVVEMKLLFQL